MSLHTSTDRVGRTRIRVSPGRNGERCRVRSAVSLSDPTAANLRPIITGHDERSATVSLVPEGALLLAGDGIELDVTVDSGVHLTLLEPGGTVAFNMRGGNARWDVRIEVADDAGLTWAGQPFVVAQGAEVERRTRIRAHRDARLALREVLVLGRHGERPGAIRQNTVVADDRGLPLLVEDLPLNEDSVAGLLGGNRAVVSVLSLGAAAVSGPTGPDRYDLHREGAVLWRRLGAQAHEAALPAAWTHALTRAA